MLTLLKQLIYPTLEYNSVLWNPFEPELIELLESIQSNFLKKIDSPLPQDSDYIDRLQHFKLYSMQRRRERYAIMYTWKVINGIYPNPGIHFNSTTEDHIAHPNEGIQINIHQRDDITAHHDTELPDWLKNQSILQKCCDLFNLIPLHLREVRVDDEEPDFDAFKKEVDSWLEKVPDRPNCPRRPKLGKTNSLVHQVKYMDR